MVVYLMFRCMRILCVVALLSVAVGSRGQSYYPDIINDSGVAFSGPWSGNITIDSAGGNVAITFPADVTVTASGTYQALVVGGAPVVLTLPSGGTAVDVSGLVMPVGWSVSRVESYSTYCFIHLSYVYVAPTVTYTNVVYVTNYYSGTNATVLNVETIGDDVWPSVAAGTGFGFMVCGFGWVLGITRKVTGDF